MLDFTDLRIEEREILQPYLLADGSIQSDRCFSSLYIWSEHYKLKKCIKDGFLFLRAENGDELLYYMPLGEGSILPAVKQIEADAHFNQRPYSIVLITEDRKLEFDELEGYTVTEDRAEFDYIYDSSKMIDLPGKKLHSKRNFINRFLSEYQGKWVYEDVCPQRHREDILAFMREWCENREDNDDYTYEYSAIIRALDNWKVLKMRGGLIKIDGRVIAFTMATNQGDDVMDILIEKADGNIIGAYQMINNAFASLHCREVKYINREEDLGIEGLRISKLSYKPVFLTKKYAAIPKENV